MSSYKGELRLEIFGQSHGECVGMHLDGVPAGVKIDLDALQAFLNRRAPGGGDGATARRERDIPRFVSGVADGVTDGGRITAVIANEDARPADYAALRLIPRPGHADYTAYMKHGEIAPGGGQFSGRMTAPLCVAGGICKQLLSREGIEIISRISELAGIADDGTLTRPTANMPFPTVSREQGEKMRAAIAAAKAEGDSVGGVIECAVMNAPVGLGGALFDGLEGRIAALALAIPAVKGVEFGAGFAAAKMRGSENNDAFAVKNGRVVTETNNSGGILGGISDGMPIVFRVAVKPTPSIAAPQKSVDLAAMRETEISVTGRHDACIVPRAVPCVEAVAAIAVYDALLARRREAATGETDLAVLRRRLDAADRALFAAFDERMALSGEIGAYKRAHDLPVSDLSREGEKSARIAAAAPEGLGEYSAALYAELARLSREYQAASAPTEDEP